MSGAHGGEWLHRPGDSVVHRAPARTKVVAVLTFAVLVVVTPREWVAAHAAAAVLLAALVVVSGVGPGLVARRLTVELPFVVFALALPFVGQGPTTEVGGITLSEPGLWAAWGLLAKATLTVVAAVLLAATTPARHLVLALEQLRLPRELTQVMAFMLRYVHVVADESARMRVARESRGFEPRTARAWPVLGRAVGALFVRAYERGERVHLAMLARGHEAR